MAAVDARVNARLNMQVPVALHVANDQESLPIKLTTENVSSGGAYFHIDQPMPTGTAVKMDIVIPIDLFEKIDAEKSLYTVAGTVVRIDDEGMAVSFEKKLGIIH